MSSKRKIAANRQNAAHSTGPRTADGKTCASRNAYQHGLAVSVLDDPAISVEVERLVRTIVGKRRAPYELVQARIIAEAELDLLRIRAMRAKIIDSMAEANSLGDSKLAKEPVPGAKDTAALPNSPIQSEIQDAPRALVRALPQLEALERYERRAFSRRRRAIKRMYRSSI